MRKLVSILVAGLVAAPALAQGSPETKRIEAAEQALQAVIAAPDGGIPADLFKKAECIGVFPGVTKGAFVVGGEYGRGVFTCRQKDGELGAPAFFTIGGASVGFQAGAREVDLVLLIMNQEGVSKLLQDKFTIGGEASVAAGPVGRTAEAATDAQMHAQILSWSRSRGVFLGASLEGTVVKPDKKATEDYYGRRVTARQILVDESVRAPKSARAFLRLANEYARQPS